MQAMIETLESRTLLSVAPVDGMAHYEPPNFGTPIGDIAPYPTPVNDFPSPVGRYMCPIVPNAPANSHGTFVIQHWNTAAGTMQFKLIDQNGDIHRGVGKIISGDSFKCRFQTGNRITTIKASFTNYGQYADARGTYITRNLQGVQKATGEFQNTRYISVAT